MNFLSVDVLVTVRNGVISDCTNGGVSATADEHYIVCPDGNWTEDDLLGRIEDGNKVGVYEMKPLNVGTKTYYHANPLNFNPETKTFEKETRWTMMGGNYIETSDSRFPFDYPLPVHDRIEGK